MVFQADDVHSTDESSDDGIDAVERHGHGQQYGANAYTNYQLHKRYRHVAYRQLARFLYGIVGRYVRYVLPACAINKIREKFPNHNDNAQYMVLGFVELFQQRLTFTAILRIQRTQCMHSEVPAGFHRASNTYETCYNVCGSLSLNKRPPQITRQHNLEVKDTQVSAT